MEKTNVSTRVNTDIKESLNAAAKQKNIKVSRLVRNILKDHVTKPKATPSNIRRIGKALDCPLYPQAINPRYTWVDMSVCETCSKTIHGKPCPSWKDYQSARRVESF